jgi:hypothetical protein
MTVAETFRSPPGTRDGSAIPPSATVSIADQSCNSGAHGLVAVNALNCNNVEVGNDLVDVVGLAATSTSSGHRVPGDLGSPRIARRQVSHRRARVTKKNVRWLADVER